MAETAGETVIFLVLSVIFILVIVLVFAYFLLFGFGFSNASTCYGSSQIRNFFYNSLCVTQYFCIADTLEGLGVLPPLLGCSPLAQSYGATSTTGQIFSGVTLDLAQCWYQYGASSNLNVIDGNGQLCGVINVDTNQNITIKDLTNYLQTSTYAQKISCINHTAVQSCPGFAPNPNQNWSCDLSDSAYCQLTTFNYFQCQDQRGYVPTPQGYQLDNIFLDNPNTKTNALDNLTGALCQSAFGCYFNTATGNCTNTSSNMQLAIKSSNSCFQSFQDFCKTYPNGNQNCTVAYDPTDDFFTQPQGCTLTEPVKPTSVVNISYADYLSPGTNLIFSYKNKTATSGANQTGYLLSPYANLSISHSQLYFVYLNTFAGTPYPPNLVGLPSECAPVSFFNNYPNSAIQDQCTRALISYGIIGAAAGLKENLISTPKGVMILGGTFAAGYAYGVCESNQFCNRVIDGSINNAASVSLITTTGLGQCLSSIGTWIDQQGTSFLNSFSQVFTGQNAVQNLNFLGRNQLYVCAVTS